jgi:hypothetical protein
MTNNKDKKTEVTTFDVQVAEFIRNHKKQGSATDDEINDQLVIPFTWKYTRCFSEGLAPVVNDDVMWGFIDKNGQTVIPCIWKGARDFCEGLAPVMNDDRKWGFIDKNGENVIPCKWLDVDHFTEGLSRNCVMAVNQTEYQPNL